jgi:hypothetical protein
MKLTVITGSGGKIVGTAFTDGKHNPAAGSGGLIAGKGQTLHVIDAPEDFERIAETKELHQRVKTLLPKKKKKKK